MIFLPNSQRVKKDEIEENALAVDQVGGVFVVLVVGMAFSFILSILEFLWNIRKVAVIEKVTMLTLYFTNTSNRLYLMNTLPCKIIKICYSFIFVFFFRRRFHSKKLFVKN